VNLIWILFIDGVYCGIILGKQDEANHLLNMVIPEFRKEIKQSSNINFMHSSFRMPLINF